MEFFRRIHRYAALGFHLRPQAARQSDQFELLFDCQVALKVSVDELKSTRILLRGPTGRMLRWLGEKCLPATQRDLRGSCQSRRV